MHHRVLAVLLSACLVFAGCASTTVIQSEPAGAQVRIDGMPVGNTPVTFTDNAVWLWTSHQVSLERKGYDPYHTMLNAQVSPLYLILGLLCLLPFLVVGEYRPSYMYVMVKKQAVELIQQGLEEFASIEFH